MYSMAVHSTSIIIYFQFLLTTHYNTLYCSCAQVGPGFLNTTVILPFAEGIFILTFVPEGPLKIRLTSHLYFDWWMPAFMAHNMIHNMATQVTYIPILIIVYFIFDGILNNYSNNYNLIGFVYSV